MSNKMISLWYLDLSIIYISIPRWPRNIAQQCARWFLPGWSRSVRKEWELVGEYLSKEPISGSKVHNTIIILRQNLHSYQTCHWLHPSRIKPSSCTDSSKILDNQSETFSMGFMIGQPDSMLGWKGQGITLGDVRAGRRLLLSLASTHWKGVWKCNNTCIHGHCSTFNSKWVLC